MSDNSTISMSMKYTIGICIILKINSVFHIRTNINMSRSIRMKFTMYICKIIRVSTRKP